MEFIPAVIKNKTIWLLALLLSQNGFAQQARVEENFDKGWLFARYGLQADGSVKQEPSAIESKTFEDAQWRTLNLPHDWAVEGPFRTDLDGNTCELPWRGIGLYRKHFNIANPDKGKQFYIDFDGAMANAELWLNGHKAGERPYGYSSFRVNLTPYILVGKENVIAVRLNTEKPVSRWYPGAGIYRHVWLVKTNPVHVTQWGAFVTTPDKTDAQGKANASVTIINYLAKEVVVHYTVETCELEKNDVVGRRVGVSAKQQLPIKPNQSNKGMVSLQIENPKHWGLETPIGM
jgi:beta-galactosidase